MHRLPDFIIVGAQKCGTSSLHVALGKHPDVFVSTPKELDFFQDDTNYARGIEWYASFFKDCPPGCLAAGESSPEYFHYEGVAERIANVAPNVKIIVLLRNPADRAFSGYWHAVRAAGESLPFERALEAESERTAADPFALRYFSYAQRGHYARQLEPYFEYFERSQILVLIAEEYFADQRATLVQVAGFLGVPCDDGFLDVAGTVFQNKGVVPRFARLHRLFPHVRWRFPRLARIWFRLNTREKTGAVAMAPETRARLMEFYAESNEQLEKLLGRDLSIWSRCSGTPQD